MSHSPRDVSCNALGGKWGKDSDEYEKIGGTRKSERKKPVKKPKPEKVG